MIADTFARSQQLQSRLPGLTFLSLEKPCETVATEIESLNNLLPKGGIASGSFVEILSAQEGSGAYALALTLARKCAGEMAASQSWAVVDPEGTFYPPAASAMGYDLKRLILLRPKAGGAGDDDVWAFTQLLRSADIAVCFWMTSRMDSMVFRRLQLAAERGGGLGFVIRPAAAERKPCWASLRLMARPLTGLHGSGVRVRVLHAAQAFVDSEREVEVVP